MVANRHNHGLHYALLVSLGLHALLLFSFTDWWEPARRVLEYPTVLVARLMAPEPAPPPPAPPIEKPAPPKKKPPTPEAVRAPSPVAAPPAPAAPVPIEAPATPPPVAAARPAPAPAGPSAAEVVAQTAEQYRMALIAAMRRIKDDKRYPPQAHENNWQGDVAVGIAIGANGRASVSVKRSSQYTVLDRQAVEILEQAFREVPMPPALRGRELALRDVTVRYELPKN